MKKRGLLNLLKNSLPWMLLIAIINVFFIFLAWVTYPETFKLLIGIMIVFSVSSSIVSLFILWKKERKRDKVFYVFLKEPTLAQENRLIETVGELHKEKINYLANKLRTLDDKLDEGGLQIAEYEEFIENWVHEIKTPISLATLVLENRKEEMSPLVYKRLEHARININDGIERILFYARLKAAHIDYRLERTSLNLCCENVALELKALLDERKVELILEIEDLPIISDKRALKFILTQIFVNSVKYSNENVDSFISLETGFNIKKNRCFLRISDNGVGVLSSDLPFIFDKGFTGYNPTSTKSTGMGLYLVKKLCDELQIEITVQSEFGNGFTINLFFPIVEDMVKQ